MTDQSAARRANSILATPQDKLAVLCPDKTPAPGMADPMQIEDDSGEPYSFGKRVLVIACLTLVSWGIVAAAFAMFWVVGRGLLHGLGWL